MHARHLRCLWPCLAVADGEAWNEDGQTDSDIRVLRAVVGLDGDMKGRTEANPRLV